LETVMPWGLATGSGAGDDLCDEIDFHATIHRLQNQERKMPPILTLSNLSFFRNDRPILQNINWSVAQASVAAVVGPNGCGKSTLLRLISGYLWPTTGSISLLGHTLGQYPLQKLRQRIGIVEATTVYPFDEIMTALDVAVSGYFSSLSIAYVSPTPEQFSHARQTLASVGLADCAAQLFSTLSTGQRLRVLIARALVRRPELLVLDEPTAGLDLPARESVLATVNTLAHQQQNRPAIIIVTHHLEELLPDTSNILLLSLAGQIIASGPPAQVLTDAHMTAAYDWPIQVHQINSRYHAHTNPATWRELL
jgi:iron complex transport system ATP-binding protein